jgi:hypothetical protein
VCKGFKFEEKQIKSVLSSMMDALDKMNYTGSSRSAESDFFVDIFTSLEIPIDLERQVTSINNSLLNDQYKVINKMIEFIDKSNYHGDDYRQYRERQIELSKYWISTFFPDTTKKSEAIVEAQKLVGISEKEESNMKAKMLKSFADYESTTEVVTKAKAPATKAKVAPKKMARVTASKSKSKSKSKTKTKTKSKAKTGRKKPASKAKKPVRKGTKVKGKAKAKAKKA